MDCRVPIGWIMPKFTSKTDRYLIFFFILLFSFLLILLGCLLLLNYLTKQQIQSAQNRFDSYIVVDELRQSSDDLTKMVRLYVETGEKKYRDYFYEILAIRNGTSPRPVCYDQIYWDLVLDEKRPCPNEPPKSLNQKMIEQKYTLEEFNLLKESHNISDALVNLETKAMNAMVGKFEDSSGHYTINGKPNPELARNLVFGEEYMKTKAQIMAPLQRFFEAVEKRTSTTNEEFNRLVLGMILAATILSILTMILMLYCISKAIKTITKTTQENEMLLLNILPKSIVERLKGGEELIADEYPQASILFADIVGFTSMTYKIGVTKMVDILSKLFDAFDDLTTKYGVEKVKTIGDNYMAVSGVPIPTPDHAIRLANFALALRDEIQKFNHLYQLDLQMRIGMTYGSVIAGIIGHKKFIYDVWGDVVNTASRMENTSLPGEIHITEKMAWMLNEHFDVIERDPIEIKGKGIMKTYFLKGRKIIPHAVH